MFKDAREAFDIYIDASLTGMGACWNKKRLCSIPTYFSHCWSEHHSKILNVLIVMRIFTNVWENQNIRFHVDNKAVVYALNKGKIRDIYLQKVARPIWLIAAMKDIDIEYLHIPGIDNVKAYVLYRMFQDVWAIEKLNLFNDYVWWQVEGNFLCPNLLV